MSGLSTNGSDVRNSPGAVTRPIVPLDERLFPQLSLRFLLGMIALSAVVLWTLRAALIGGQFWAKCAVVVLGTIGGCFLVYALFFLLALVIATVSFPVIREVLHETEATSPPSSHEPPEASTP